MLIKFHYKVTPKEENIYTFFYNIKYDNNQLWKPTTIIVEASKKEAMTYLDYDFPTILSCKTKVKMTMDEVIKEKTYIENINNNCWVKKDIVQSVLKKIAK